MYFFDNFNEFVLQNKGLFICSSVLLINIHFIREILFLFFYGKTSKNLYYENQHLKEENEKLKNNALKSLSKSEKLFLLSSIFSNFNFKK